MLARLLRRRRPRRVKRARPSPSVQPYENPYKNGICAADWTKK